MSSNNSQQGNNNNNNNPPSMNTTAVGGGLSHSTPLVTLPSAPPGGPAMRPLTTTSSAKVTVVGADHPLALLSTTTTTTTSSSSHTTTNIATSKASAPSLGITTTQKETPSSSASSRPAGQVLPPSAPEMGGNSASRRPVAPPAQPPSMPLSSLTPPPPLPPGAAALKIPSHASSNPPLAARSMDEQADAFLSEGFLEEETSASPSLLSSSWSRRPNKNPPRLQPEPLPAKVTDLERLGLLSQRRAYQDVVYYAEQMLRGSTSHYAPLYQAWKTPGPTTTTTTFLDSQQDQLTWILLTYGTALIKLRRKKEWATELFRDWVHFCPYLLPGYTRSPATAATSSPGTWTIPYKLHIFAASSLQYLSPEEVAGVTPPVDPSSTPTESVLPAVGSEAALQALWALRADLPTQSGQDGELQALLDVEQALANVLIRRQDWRLALQCLDRMQELLQTGGTGVAGAETSSASLAAYSGEVYARQGRILLQVGAVEEAAQLFELAAQATRNQSPASDDASKLALPAWPAQLSMNEGLLAFARGQFDQALEFFRQVVQHVRKVQQQNDGSAASDLLVAQMEALRMNSSGRATAVTIPLESLDDLYQEAVNNMSLCALYSCRLPAAVRLMEELVREDPPRYLTERVALNLCTLYELSSESAARKKRVLQCIAQRFFLQDISPECFRVN